MAVPTRDPIPAEQAHLEEVLLRLREHFPEWPYPAGYEHDLAAFAFYEGCGGSDHCGAILAQAAPFALGRELVARHGFRWVMIALKKGDTWRYGVAHPALTEPVDLLSLEDGAWNREEYDPGGEPSPGERTHDSLETILQVVRTHPIDNSGSA